MVDLVHAGEVGQNGLRAGSGRQRQPSEPENTIACAVALLIKITVIDIVIATISNQGTVI